LLKRTFIALAVGLVLFFASGLLSGLYSSATTQDFWIALCDSATVSGVTLLAVGLLTWSANSGTFDIFTFGTQRLWWRIRRKTITPDDKHYSLYNYRQAGHNRKFLHLVVAGAVFLCAAIIIIFLFD